MYVEKIRELVGIDWDVVHIGVSSSYDLLLAADVLDPFFQWMQIR